MEYIDLFKPSFLKNLCAEFGFQPSKQYGQNYLISDRPIQAMIAAAQLKPTDTVVEIGPGFGVLTLALAPRVQKVISYEIEKKLLPYWEERMKEFSSIEIVWGNALRHLVPPNNYKVLANLPYQITAIAIRTVLELTPAPEMVVIMVQKEVADRICAPLGEPKTKGKTDFEVGLLTVAVQYYGKAEIITNVSRGSFWPSPKVDSAVVRISNIQTRPQAKAFFTVVRAGFAHKRKILASNLADGLHVPIGVARETVARVTGNEKIRAENMTISQWEELVDQLSCL
jgi:16S rRNA (adenine1518-N6/adenine1519-N6)-dimethyltransferase